MANAVNDSLVQEAGAACAAVTAGDVPEARFRLRLLMARSGNAGEMDLAIAAARLYERLGPFGGRPANGYSVTLLGLADAIERIEGRSALPMAPVASSSRMPGALWALWQIRCKKRLDMADAHSAG